MTGVSRWAGMEPSSRAHDGDPQRSKHSAEPVTHCAEGGGATVEFSEPFAASESSFWMQPLAREVSESRTNRPRRFIICLQVWDAKGPPLTRNLKMSP